VARIPETVEGSRGGPSPSCSKHGVPLLSMGRGSWVCPECSPIFVEGNPNRRERRLSYKSFRRYKARTGR
jgi:hypothetical protein